MGAKYECVIVMKGSNLTLTDHIDPVKNIIVDNGERRYEFDPENIESIEIKKLEKD